MHLASIVGLLFLFMGTGCYTQIHVGTDDPETVEEHATPLPDPRPIRPIGGPWPIPSPPPLHVVLVVETPTPELPPSVRHSGTQRPSDDQRSDRSDRSSSLPPRGR